MKQRRARRIELGYLRNLSLWYLERWEAPRAGVERTLRKRVYRAVQEHDQDLQDCLGMVGVILDELEANGLVDDRRYADSVVARQRERGSSERRIMAFLSSKGVDREVAQDALRGNGEQAAGDPERMAAIRLARRRRFGPWRRHDAKEGAPQRELASMARAGFGYGIAKEILESTDADALEDELPRGW